MDKVKTEIDSEAPVLRETDVVVVGSGSAGWTAAVSASRCGAKVVLVERNYEVGGTATTSMMHLFGAPAGKAHGLMREVLNRLEIIGEAKAGELTPYDGQAYCSLVFEMLKEHGVELLLGVTFIKTLMSGKTATGVVIATKEGMRAVKAKVVIDATGDGDVCADAGADYVLGRASDHRMRPITLLFRIGNIHTNALIGWVKEHPDEFKDDKNSHIIDDAKGLYRLHGFFKTAEAGRIAGELDKDCHYIRFEYVWPERNTALINSTRVYGVNALDPAELSAAIVAAREQIKKLFLFIRARIPGCGDAYIIDVSTMPGIRETRHIVGDYILTEKDLERETVFEDMLFRDYRRVCPGAAVHSPDGNEGGVGDTLEREKERRLYTFTLPYRCFLPKGLEGILTAGRCFSATHQADGWTRDTPGCILMGQGVGAAAAESVKEGCHPRYVDLYRVREALIQQHVEVR